MADHLLMKSSAPAAASTTESSSPGLLVPFSGVASNRPGDVLVGGLSLIWLVLAVLAMLYPAWILPVLDGIQSLRSTTKGSRKKPNNGGTAND